MIEFGYILIIIFEIIITIIIVAALIFLENKVRGCLLAINIEASKTLNILCDVKLKLKDFNKKIKETKNFDFKKAKQVLSLCLDIINFILLLRTLNFRSDIKDIFKNKYASNFMRSLKKGLLGLLIKKVIRFLT